MCNLLHPFTTVIREKRVHQILQYITVSAQKGFKVSAPTSLLIEFSME